MLCISLHHQTATQMKTEFIIWGIDAAKGGTIEDILHTTCETYQEAKNCIQILEKKYGCKNCRIQIIDFSQPVNFANEFAKTVN
jgi:hypothetical protein